ncbi:hypothetical protein E2C01_003929 [Portunus trituberculatus]|uniref:Uncharacterized protein n=1 Tax=Portunus trituberculatus TaxID=210409 RepID=A0A5B7CQ18_PORTR|nr:hypothetical protein [Portunus trituberculatus]
MLHQTPERSELHLSSELDQVRNLGCFEKGRREWAENGVVVGRVRGEWARRVGAKPSASTPQAATHPEATYQEPLINLIVFRRCRVNSVFVQGKA